MTKVHRNLFAIDYIKSHPVTAAEFRAVYAALDGDTLKVRLSKVLKFNYLTMLIRNMKPFHVKRRRLQANRVTRLQPWQPEVHEGARFLGILIRRLGVLGIDVSGKGISRMRWITFGRYTD